MLNPMHYELGLIIHRERVAAGIRRAARSSGHPPDPRRRPRRRLSLRLRMA